MSSWLSICLGRFLGFSIGGPLDSTRGALGPPVAPVEVVPTETATELPPLPRPRDPREDQWIDLLLCPARAGIVVTTTDMARIARDLHVKIDAVALHAGLHALMARHPAGTLRRLASAAEMQADAYERHPRAEAHRWADRARRTAELLREQATLIGTQLLLVSECGELRAPTASCNG